jgi:hypothetical protein
VTRKNWEIDDSDSVRISSLLSLQGYSNVIDGAGLDFEIDLRTDRKEGKSRLISSSLEIWYTSNSRLRMKASPIMLRDEL